MSASRNKYCNGCESFLPLEKFRLRYDRTRDPRARRSLCIECERGRGHRNAASLRRKDLLDELKVERGCCVCGYNRCGRALAFHHCDSSEKEFGIGSNNIRSMDLLREEVGKCIILCFNCHMEYHAGLIDIEGLFGHRVPSESIYRGEII